MQTDIAAFQSEIKNFYKEHKRNFPWRETIDPYHIFISEIMLQQTQTSRVVEKYLQFLNVFPTITHLAEASFSEVLTVWSGLGYNRRAKYLHEAAKVIVSTYKGDIPHTVAELDALPGIGENTAAAILVYSSNSPIAFIETNIRRVYIHHFFQGKIDVSDKEIVPLVENTMDKLNPREWFWALMDYGSHLPKITVNPNRKSKHYTKQSKFEGSVRQVRGSILRILLKKNSVTTVQLQKEVEGEPLHFDRALESLIAEGLVLKKEELLCIQ